MWEKQENFADIANNIKTDINNKVWLINKTVELLINKSDEKLELLLNKHFLLHNWNFSDLEDFRTYIINIFNNLILVWNKEMNWEKILIWDDLKHYMKITRLYWELIYFLDKTKNTSISEYELLWPEIKTVINKTKIIIRNLSQI